MPISIDQEISIENPNNVTISGTATSLNVGVLQVEVFQNGVDQGAVALNGDGTWSFNAFIPDTGGQFLTAVLTDPQNNNETSNVLSVNPGFPLNRQIASATFSDKGTSAIVYSTGGRALYDLTVVQSDAMAVAQVAEVIGRGGAGIAYEDLLFTTETIKNFRATGTHHDTLNLSDTSLHTLAQVIQHTTMNGGSATIHVDEQTSVKLEGVTKEQMKAHPHDFVFTGGHILS